MQPTRNLHEASTALGGGSKTVSDLTELTDGQLLERFLKERHEPAFEELVRRHALLVMGACRRVLGEHPEVDETFQNTFLVLLKKAHSLVSWKSIRGWRRRWTRS